MARIAIIGTGISGLGAAWLLHREHDITVYEKAPRIGGHSRTVTVDYDGHPIAVDTGFIVFNKPNYPNLTGLFAHLGVPSHESDMGFALSVRNGWLEWGAQNTNAIFGQRRNLLRPRFLDLIGDVMRFNAHAEEMVERHPDLSLDQLIARLKLGEWFRRYYLLPMSGAIWSCPPAQMLHFPARALVKFFANHQLLSFTGQPQWRTVTGGAQEYLRRLTAPFHQRIRVNCGAVAVTRTADQVQVKDSQGGCEIYDRVVMAAHGDETLALLKDADGEERETLSAFHYQRNIAVLHRDDSVMPRRKRCWASWVYHSDGDFFKPKITVSYWMNQLQAIDRRYPLFVSLNPKCDIAPEKVFDRAEFDHPIFDRATVAAQSQVAAMQGRRRTRFAGAHLRHGFHEDGLASAVAVARQMGSPIPWEAPEIRDTAQPLGAARPLLPGFGQPPVAGPAW